MTSKQLERKVSQLYNRKRLIETVEGLEEAIKTFMLTHGKTEIHTERFIISLEDGRLDISMRAPTDQNQLTLNFTNPNEKEDFNNEGIDPEKTTNGRTRPRQRRRVQAHRSTNPERCEDHR